MTRLPALLLAVLMATGAGKMWLPPHHILLGLKVLAGVIFFYIAIKFSFKAFSESVERIDGEATFVSHLAGGLLCFILSTLLIFSVLVQSLFGIQPN